MSNTSDMKKLVRLLRKLDVTVERTRNGHWAALCPDGTRVVFATTPSDHRAIANTRSALRRHGVDLPR